MDAGLRGRLVPTVVPAAVVNVVAGRGRAAQFQKSHVTACAVHQQGGAAHCHGLRSVRRRTAGGAVPVEEERPIRHATAQAMVRCQKVGCSVLAAVVHERASARAASVHHDHGHRTDLVAPIIALGTDHVDVARAAVAQCFGLVAQDAAVTVGHLPDTQTTLAGHGRGFDVLDGEPVTTHGENT